MTLTYKGAKPCMEQIKYLLMKASLGTSLDLALTNPSFLLCSRFVSFPISTSLRLGGVVDTEMVLDASRSCSSRVQKAFQCALYKTDSTYVLGSSFDMTDDIMPA